MGFSGIIYVANSHSNTVSVINGTTNSVVTKVNVGSSPFSIAVNPLNNLIYVTNLNSDTISVIDAITNRLTALVKFNVNPPNSASMYCNGEEIKKGGVIYDIGVVITCEAKAVNSLFFSYDF
jgi:YVTN family beta-propeller protein